MKQKLIWILPLMIAILAFGVTAAATCTIEEDASGTIHNGTRSDETYGMTWIGRANIIVNVSENTGATNITNCTATIATRSGYDATANTSESIKAARLEVWNMTAHDSIMYLNDTVQTACGGTVGNAINKCLEDGFYTLTVTCYNTTGVAFGSCTDTANVMVDNTAPNAVTQSSPADEYKSEKSDVALVATTTSNNVTSCTLTFDTTGIIPKTNNIKVTESTGTISHTMNDLGNTGVGYKWYYTCTDGKNTSTSSTRTLFVDKPSTGVASAAASAAGAQAAAAASAAGGRSGMGSSTVVWIGIIAAAAYLFGTSSGAAILKGLKIFK